MKEHGSLNTDVVIDMISSMGLYLTGTEDEKQKQRDLNELLDLIRSVGLSFGGLLGLGATCALKGGYVEQRAAVHTGNWRMIVDRLRDEPLGFEEAMCLDLCANLNELTGRDLHQLQNIADMYL